MQYGNRCGHQPQQPRGFVPPAEHRPRPSLLTKLSARLGDYYQAPSHLLPSLNLANGSDRQQRSERRESCLIVLNVLIHYLDLASLRVGIPQAGDRISGLTVEFLATRAGLHKRRVERAMADLVKARLITIQPLAQRHTDGSYSGKGAIRAVTKTLFAVFGLEHWLKYERDRAAAKRRKQRLRDMRKDRARRDLVTGDLFRRSPPKPADTPNRTEELTRLMREHPEWSIESLFTLLGRKPQTHDYQPA